MNNKEGPRPNVGIATFDEGMQVVNKGSQNDGRGKDEKE